MLFLTEIENIYEYYDERRKENLKMRKQMKGAKKGVSGRGNQRKGKARSNC